MNSAFCYLLGSTLHQFSLSGTSRSLLKAIRSSNYLYLQLSATVYITSAWNTFCFVLHWDPWKKPKVAITMIVTWDSQVWSIVLSPWSLDVDCIQWDLLVPNLTPPSFCHHVNSNVKYLPSPSGMCINSDMSSQATNTPHILFGCRT